jgi:hypothetical protein
MNSEHFSFRSAAIQGGFLGVAAGNIMAAPFVGKGSIFWVVFVFAMLVSSAFVAYGNRFVHVGVVALITLPLLFAWQAIHQVSATPALLLSEVAVVVLGGQLAAGLVTVVVAVKRK